MKHFGDITKLNGADLPIVDIITGGSPCQDLSVAGKRAGLDGERSGLFMEQIRIVKEMRDECARQLQLRGSDDDIRPRYMVWENVHGAFSSNKGEDFRVVLEEIARIKDKAANVPMPEGGARWSTSGCIMGDGWSIAWRLHDAQFWGVPQRRKRIALVADFGGESAPEILFERKSLSRDSSKSGEERQGTSETLKGNINETISFQERAGCEGGGKGILIQHERTGALSTLNNQSVLSNKCLNPWDVQSKHIQPESGKAEALYSGECRYGGGESYVMQEKTVYGICSDGSNSMKSSNPHSGIYEADTTRTLDLNGGNPNCNQGGMVIVQEAVCSIDEKMGNTYVHEEQANTLGARDYKQPQAVCYGLDRASFNQGENAKYDFAVDEEIAQTIVARGPGGVLKTQ